MLDNPYHEVRFCALFILVLLYEKTDNTKEIVDFYLKNVQNINNWDLVDFTAHKIIGAEFLKTGDSTAIYALANSNHIWSERIAVVSQWSVIKAGKFDIILELCEKFLTHKHDLMHKATGWMLREVGKKDEKTLLKFLNKNSKSMPRTMLRYSIEKLTSEQRKFYMEN
jgi:3-methyladenine DNA glycosylase AlkD